jgi:tetratricopeptide (TPR) repeat protein
MLDIKVLYERLEVCDNDEERLHIVFDIATYFLNTNEQRTLELAEELNTIAERIDSNLGRCYQYSTIGRLLYRKSQYDEASVAFMKALELSLLTPDLLMQAICYDSLVVVHGPQNKYDLALENSYKALALYEQIPGKASMWQKSTCYNNIGIAYKHLNKLDEAEENYLKGLAITDLEPNDRIRNIILNNLCQVKIAQGKFAEGINYGQTALEGFKELNHKVGESHALIYLAHCKLGQGDFAIALQGYIAALKLLKEIDNKTAEIEALKGIGNVYSQMEAYGEAIAHYQKALLVAPNKGNEPETCDLYLCLAKAHAAQNQTEAALKALDTGMLLAQNHQLNHLLEGFETQRMALLPARKAV